MFHFSFISHHDHVVILVLCLNRPQDMMVGLNNNNNSNTNVNKSDNNNNDTNNNNCDGEIFVSDDKGGDFPGFPGKRSIAERRGFNTNAPRINTALFRTATVAATVTTPLVSPSARSPRITIPPGISPAALLDSPILLLNSQVSMMTLLILLSQFQKKDCFFVLFL